MVTFLIIKHLLNLENLVNLFLNCKIDGTLPKIKVKNDEAGNK